MVVCTVVAVTGLVLYGAPISRVAAVSVAAGNMSAVPGTAAWLASVTAHATSAGAIAGAADIGISGAIIGAVIAGTSAAGMGFCRIGAGRLAAKKEGWMSLLVGANQSPADNHFTYDCWKPVIHDTSTEPSTGMLLADLLRHNNVAKYSVTEETFPGLPRITLENAWNESFEIEYVVIRETGEMASHVKRLPDQ